MIREWLFKGDVADHHLAPRIVYVFIFWAALKRLFHATLDFLTVHKLGVVEMVIKILPSKCMDIQVFWVAPY